MIAEFWRQRTAQVVKHSPVTPVYRPVSVIPAPCHMLALALAGLFSAPAWAAQPLGCLIEPERTAEIGSQVVGVIETINVERGDRVSKGQILAMLHAQSERAAVGVAKAKLAADADVKAAEASAIFARQQLKRSEDLFEKNFISRQALDQSRTEADVSQQKLGQAREQKRIADRELGYVQAQLAQRQIHSPFDGIVAERYLSPGERIEEKPLLRLAQVNPLRVQVVAPVGLYGQIGVGDHAAVLPEMPNGQPHTATVVQVDKIVDPASNTFRVVLQLPNPDLALPAGLRCKADFSASAQVAVRPLPPPVTKPASTASENPAPTAASAAATSTPPRDSAVPEGKASATLINVPSLSSLPAVTSISTPAAGASPEATVEVQLLRQSAISAINADHFAGRQAASGKALPSPTSAITPSPASPNPVQTQAVIDVRSTHLAALSVPTDSAPEPILLRQSALAVVNADYFAQRNTARANDKPVAASTVQQVSGPITTADRPSATVAERQTTPANDANGTIVQTLDHWQSAWSNKDLDAYLACYAADFRPADGRPRAAWTSERRQRFAESGAVHVHYDQLQISLADGEHARLRLRQHYSSGKEKFFTSKELQLVKRNDRWLIVSEKKTALNGVMSRPVDHQKRRQGSAENMAARDDAQGARLAAIQSARP